MAANPERRYTLEEYFELDSSFSEYLLVAQHRPHVTQFFKQADGSWAYKEFNDLSSTVKLASLDCDLPLSEIYDGVGFDAETTA